MDTINILGIDRPIKFGSWVYKEFARIRGVEMDEVLEILTKKRSEDFMLLVYCAFVYGAKLEGAQIDFEEVNVWDWFENEEGISDEVIKIFSKSQPRSKNVKAPKKGQP